jgi:hypothetical protein
MPHNCCEVHVDKEFERKVLPGLLDRVYWCALMHIAVHKFPQNCGTCIYSRT